MSIIAVAVLAMGADPTAARVQTTAAQAVARARSMTSIGPDPCRAPVGDEIVVCGRRESLYALPLYEPIVSDDGLTGREREDLVDDMKDLVAACHARAEACLKPLPIIRVPVGRGSKSGIFVGKD